MRNIKMILILMSFFAILALFMGSVSADSMNLTETGLASEGIKNYTEAHGHIPGYADISDKNSTASSFLKTVTKTTVQLNSGSTTPVTISSVKNPAGSSGSATGTLYKSEYVTVAKNVYNYISSNGQAPNYASSSLGKIRYETLIYTYSKIVNFYRYNGYLPNYVTVVYHAGVDSTGVVIDNVPPSVSNSLPSGTYNTTKSVILTVTDHFDANPKVYYSTDNGATWNNRVKTVTLTLNSGTTTLKYYGRDASGNIGTTQTASYTVDIKKPSIPNINLDNLLDAASFVQSYIESNHKLPANVTINGTTINMAQFLKLAATASININSRINNSIPLDNCTAATNPSETISTSGNLSKTDYLNLASSVKSYMDSNKQAPNYQTISMGNMRYESLVYTFAQILNSYNTAQVLPDYITIRPWTTVTNISTTFSIDQISKAAAEVKTYVETKHNLPDYVTIGTVQVRMSDFLKLLTAGLLEINSKITTPITLKTVNDAPQPVENITNGNIYKVDYLDLAKRVDAYINANGAVPNNATSTLGKLRHESLIYAFSRTLNYYKVNNVLPNYVTVNAWSTIAIVVSLPRSVYITSDNINGVTTDTNRINTIVNGLKALGLTAINYGLGPNTHYLALQSSSVPVDALVVDIYGGADAGVIYEMGQSYYKTLVGSKKVFCVWIAPYAVDITGLAWLPRSHDDNYDPASFTGLANPDQYLKNNGYDYIYSGDLNAIITAIYGEAMT